MIGHEDMSSGSDIEEYYGIEQPPLLQQLKRILDEYRNDVQIIKELVQNADDAGAIEMKVLYQGRTINKPTVNEKKYRKFLRAPALVFYNDAKFDENDWRGIRTIYSSVKADDPLKIGQFGLGFKSVFHLTDYPCIVSGDRIMLIDPHERQSGKVCVTVKLKNITKCKRLDIDDCLQALNQTFGFSEETLQCGHYQGTLFWFPLRTTVTKLSEDIYQASQVQQLLNSFIVESKRSLIFLKTVCRVTMYVDLGENFEYNEHVPEDKFQLQNINLGKSEHFYSVAIDNDNGDLITMRQDFLKELEVIGRNIPQKSKYWKFDVHVKTEVRDLSAAVKVTKSRWLIVNYLKGSDTSQRMRELLEDENTCYHHLVGISAPVYSSSDSLSDYHGSSGHIFCYQPLPQETKSVTGLPVHVNAFFALSQNRRQVKWPDEDKVLFDKAVEWNLLLVSEIFPNAYCELLMQMIRCCENNGNPKNLIHSVYNLIPNMTKVGTRWAKLAEQFVTLSLNQKVILTAGTSRQWVTVDSVYIEPLHIESCWVAVEKLLFMDNIPLAKIPEHVHCTFKNKLAFVISHIISKHMKCSKTYRAMSREDKSNLLQFIASADEPELLMNLELIPLEDKSYASFGDRTAVYLEEVPIVIQLFPGHENQFVSSTADTGTVGILKKMIEKGSFQLQYLDTVSFAKLIKQVLSENFQAECLVDNSAVCEQWKFWTQMVWKIIQARYSQDIEQFSALTIFPLIAEENSWEDAKTMKLLCLRDKLFQIENYKFTNMNERQNLFQSLEMLSVSVIGILPSWLDKRNIVTYIHNDSFNSLVAMIERLTDLDIGYFNEKATMDQRYQLLLFLSNKLMEELPYKCLYLLRNLKLFREFELVENSPRQFVCLKENSNIFIGKTFPVRFPSRYIMTEININRVFLRYLNANIMNEEGMVRIVLRQADRYSVKERESFMLWLLVNGRYLRDEEIKNLSAQVAFVLTDNGDIKRPSELFDPEDNLLRKMFKHEPQFPCEETKYNKDILQRLRYLGLKARNDVTFDDIERTCRVCDAMSNETSKIDLEKAHALTKFLNEHSKLLCKEVLCNLRFIPLPIKCFDNYCAYLPCKTVDYGPRLCMPSEVKSSKFSHLIGSLICLVKCENLQNLSDAFGWEEPPQVTDVLAHLSVIVNNYQQRFKSSCLEMVANIYQWLSVQNITSVQRALKQSFVQNNYIWTGDGFSDPKNVVVETFEGDLNLEPFVNILPGELHEMKKFFIDIGCVESISMDTYITTLERIKDATYENTKHLSISAAKNLAVMILNKIATDCADDALNSGRQLYFPIHTYDSTTLVMKPANLCTFCDAQWLQDSDFLGEDDEISFIHADVPNATAEALGVPSLRQQMLSDAEAFEEWGQEEPLTRRLNNLLKEGYVDGFSIAKELFQNADDAGASKLWIMYDERENLDVRTQLISDGMAEWQGPALWVYNDAVFTDDDFKNITKLSGATKEDDSTKIGKFGLGFCAVYNVTDVPSFISRENVVIFDPHTSFLRNALVGRSPGLKINFKLIKNMKMLKKLRNQFKPFENVFGCNLLSNDKPYFKGTLFRLPLRQKSSEISSNVYTKKEVEILLAKIMEMSANLFLFNQNVVELKLFYLSATSPNPEYACPIFAVDKETIRLNMSPQYLFVEHTGNENRAESVTKRQISVMLAATKCKQEKQLKEQPIQIFERVSVRVDNCSKKSSTYEIGTWFVSWSSAIKDETLKMAYQEKGAIPLAAVAVPVMAGTKATHMENYELIRLDELPDIFYKIGHFFFFLPLPVEHNFQWHINGQFSVTSDRRHLRSATEDDTNTNIKQWNKCLLNDAVVQSLLYLLENLKMYCDNSKYSFHQLWPRKDNTQMTKSLPVSFYKMLTNTKLVSIFKSNLTWSNFQHCVFLHPKLRHNDGIGHIAFELMSEVTEDENLIDIPYDVYEMLVNVAESEMHVRTISHEVFLLRYFLPNLSRFQADPIKRQKRDILLKFALLFESAKVSEWLKENVCIPAEARNELMKPSHLIDPMSKVGSMFTVADGYFPAYPFNDDISLGRLKELGIMFKIMTDNLVIDRAKSIKTLNKRCTKCAFERCNVLFEYLSESKKIHLNIFLEMSSIPCIPVMAKPTTWPFQWEADEQGYKQNAKPKSCKSHKSVPHQKCEFERPCKLYDRVCANLVGCLFLISDLQGNSKNASEMKQLLSDIGVTGCQRDDVQAKFVLKQLETLTKSYDAGKLHPNYAVSKIFEDIYEHLEKALAKTSATDDIKKIFRQKSLIFVNDTFTTSDCVAEILKDNCTPYLYGLHGSPLSKYKTLIKFLGIKKYFHPRDFAKILQNIYIKQDSAPLSEEKMKTCLKLLTCLHNSMIASGIQDILDSELQAIYAPDCEKLLRDTRVMCFDDYDTIEKSKAMIYIHDSVSKSAARLFGVKRKMIQNLEESSEDIEDFYQDEPLLTRLQRLVEGYPCDTGIFKELLQNADDSGASEVCFLKDFTSRKSKCVVQEEEAFNNLLLGPSLCVFNNSSFTQKDLQGIQKLGRGSKGDDPTQTGRYGVGFNAVYNLTDVPSFLTKGPDIENGETLCFFDPNAKYVPMITKQKPGKRYKNMNAIRHFHKYLLPCYHEKVFFKDGNGTMFRLPLRNEEMAKTSEIKKDAVQEQTVTELLKAFSSEVADMLIFLKNIKIVTILTYTGHTYLRDYRIEVCLSKEDDEKRKMFLYKQVAAISNINANVNDLCASSQQAVCYELSYSEYAGKIDKPLQYHWLVVQYFGFPEKTEIHDILKENWRTGKIGLLPHGGVALQIPFGCDTIKRRSKAFCFLPLPIETGLPVHVHGYFALDHESRRSLWLSENTTSCYKTQWNLALIRYLICPAYINVIDTMRSRLLEKFVDVTSEYNLVFGEVERFQSIFPDYSATEHFYWKELAKCVYKELVIKHVLFLPVMRNNAQHVKCDTDMSFKIETKMTWTSLEIANNSFSAYFNEDSEDARKCHFLSLFNNMLRDIGMRIVYASKNMRTSMKSAGVPLETLNPKHVIDFLSSFHKKLPGCCSIQTSCNVADTNLKSVSNARIIVEFCLKDKEYFVQKLESLPIFVTEENIVKTLSEAGSLFVSDYCDFFAKEKNRFLNNSLVTLFASDLQRYKNFLIPFKLQDFVVLLKRSNMTEILSDTLIQWNGLNPPMLWIKRFWDFFQHVTMPLDGTNAKAFDVIHNLSLLPAVKSASGEKFLLSINNIKQLIDVSSFTIDSPLRKTLEKLKLPEIDKEIFQKNSVYRVVLEQVPNYRQPMKMATCLHFYKDLIKSSSLQLSEAGALTQYFDENVLHLLSVKHLLKDLPIFLSHFEEIVALSTYSEFCTVPHNFPKDGINELSETGLLLLHHSHNQRLFELLGVFTRSMCDVYIKYVFPKEATMRRTAFYRHLEYISMRLHEEPHKKQEKILSHLSAIAFVEMTDHTRVHVRNLFNPYHVVFKAMCKPTELLPMPLRKERLITLFLKIGLKNEMTTKLFEQFAMEIALEGSKNGKTKTVVANSSLLCTALFKMGITFLQNNSMQSISKIKFIVPFELEDNLLKIHEQHAEQTLICFSNSAVPSDRHICWTVSSILSNFADPCAYFKAEELQKVQQNLNICYPNFTLIKNHCENVGKSLDKILKQSPKDVPFETVKIVMEDIYKALNKLSGNDKTKLTLLKDVPLIYFPQDKYIRKAQSIVNNCTEKDQILPYLQKAPKEYGEFQELFIALGASKEPSCSNYAIVLEMLFAESGYNILLPQEQHAAKNAMCNMLKHILRDDNKGFVDLKVNKLYFLNSNEKLSEATTLVVANNPYFLSRLSQGITINYLTELKNICDKELRIDDCIGCLKRLNDKYRPYLLTDIVGEIVCLKNILAKDMREALLLEDFLHSRMFISGFLRLASHSAKRSSIPWSMEFQNRVTNLIQGITCKHVSGITTVLTVQEIQDCGLGIAREVANTSLHKVCHLEERDNKVTIYFDQTNRSWRKNIKEELIVYLNKVVLGCLKDDMIFLLSDILDMHDTPEKISEILNKKSIEISYLDSDEDNQEDRCPKPGTFVSKHLHKYLDNDYGAIYEYDYKFVAFELDDPSLNDELLQHYSSQESEMSPTYIFVRILRKMDPICDMPLMQTFEIDTGDEMPKIVPAYMLYKFIRKKENVKNTVQQLQVYTGPKTASKHSIPEKMPIPEKIPIPEKMPTLKEVYANIRRYLKEAKDETERRQIYKRLMRKWHPDKNPTNIPFCTKVCQYIQKCIKRLEKGKPLTDDESDDDNSTNDSPSKSSTFTGGPNSSWYERYWQQYEENSSRKEYRDKEYNDNRHDDFKDFFRRNYARAEPEPYHYYSEARRWQRQAQFDIEHAQSCLRCHTNPAFNWICYISHQAAENSLKAGWYAKDANKMCGVKDSCNLNTIAQDLGSELVLLAYKLSSLTKEHTHMRYPDTTTIPAETYDHDTAEQAVETAAVIVATVQRLYIQ